MHSDKRGERKLSPRFSPIFSLAVYYAAGVQLNEHLKEDRGIYIVVLPEENDFLVDCRVFYVRNESVSKLLTFFEQFIEK